jgi:hypothetical protein
MHVELYAEPEPYVILSAHSFNIKIISHKSREKGNTKFVLKK